MRTPSAALPLLILLAAAGARAEEPSPPPPPPAPGASAPGPTEAGPREPEPKRAVYVPEAVKAKLKEELQAELLAKAKAEGWAAPGQVPPWLSRLRLSGDVRARFERAMFPSGNANGGEFPDFAAIAAGSPFDVNFVDVSGERYLNVDRSRSRPRLRARVALDAALSRTWSAGARLASGDSSSPVSTNQTLGAGPGNLSKVQVWVDRAWIRLGQAGGPASGVALVAGRFENPFPSTELVWSDNVNLDGAALLGRLGGPLALTLAGAASPLQTTALAYPAERTAKFKARDKWLFSGQLGLEWHPSAEALLRLTGAFHDFYQVEGRASGACDTNLKNVTCDTDDTRPGFAQKGNTYMALRTPSNAALVAEAGGAAPRWQYFGLATPFREAVVTARAELPAAVVRLVLEAEAARNLAFDGKRLEALALNNRGPCAAGATACGTYAGGANAYAARVGMASRATEGRWTWAAALAYRHLESDAVLDAFTDSDFGLGGTNLKGLVATASLGLGDGVTLAARWSSADAIAGPPLSVDTYQLDLVARF